MQDGEPAVDDLGKHIIKFNQDFIEMLCDTALTGVGTGLGILTAGYLSGPKTAVTIGALSTCLLPFMYLGDLKL